ncbi:hypothetical protein [Pyrococcus abyssi]|uniref:YhfC family intramembrane metalloprotease n=1 Tax=Pyrococcus abyssi (strain GE5 / Orsay) TaxID=272844 RepID=Q9V1D6_PYRAB|nr:hypothetical protein [Pyrococcus abyssi]CAB49413.1 Hypothetical protein PAB0330 [Pyrococcus abyssi GE5]CCE69880.1 TPA: hypothetical protein PAB0330 [Pyrococcus abyssi GE5]
MNSAPFIILGGALAWVFLYFLRLKKFYPGEFILGIFAFVIAMAIQNMIQRTPLLWFNLSSASKLALALWFGFSAGFVQEGIKYVFVKGMKPYKGAIVGLGFGIAEVILLAVAVTIEGPSNVPWFLLVAALVERFSAVLFHVASTSLLSSSNSLVFLGVFAVHGVVDSIASYSLLINLVESPKVFWVEAIVGGIALVMLKFALPRIKIEEEEGPKW